MFKKKNIIILLGSLVIAMSLVINPDVVKKYLSNDGVLTTHSLRALMYYRVILFIAGVFLLFNNKIRDLCSSIEEKGLLPKKTFNLLFKLILIWLGLYFVFNALSFLGNNLDVPNYFPISIFNFAGTEPGWIYGIPFTFILLYCIKSHNRFNAIHFWTAGILLLFTGNLLQGGINQAFIDPFTLGAKQYFHQSQLIGNSGLEWLSSYNSEQLSLNVHAKIHPPFATLLHYYLFKLVGNNMLLFSFIISMIVSLSIPFIYYAMREAGIKKNNCGLFSILFSTIPAFNIYGVVCLDGIIATTFMIALYGIIRVTMREQDLYGTILISLGLVLSNMLTFSATFLLASIFATSVLFYYLKNDPNLMKSSMFSIIILLVIGLVFQYNYNYNHFTAFITASKIENPAGFFLFANPINYFLTRIENISEILFFLSFGILAVIGKTFKPSMQTFRNNPIDLIMLSGITVLMLMFITGAYKTGETARACLFIYPYLFLTIRNIPTKYITSLIALGGIQTFLMQISGSYFW
jgi:hypothetical protein